MASLFGDLPDEARPPPRSPSPAAEAEVAEPPAKRARSDAAPPEAAAGAAGPAGDEVSAALERLCAHVGNAKKLRKVAQLGAQLLADAQLTRKHGKAVFQFLEAAMADPARVTAPECRVEFAALLRAAQGAASRGVLNAKHAAALDVWCVAGLTANALFTDDSYEFSRTAAEVRAAFAALPDYEPEPADDAGLEAPPPDSGAVMSAEEAASAAAAAAAAASAERAASAAAARLASARRDALLSCVEAAHASYRWPWAQSVVEQLVDAAHAVAKAKLAPAQQERLQRTYIQVRDARTRRRTGGGGGGGGDLTSFERGAARYAGAEISVRKAVGSNMGSDGRGEACAHSLSFAS